MVISNKDKIFSLKPILLKVSKIINTMSEYFFDSANSFMGKDQNRLEYSWIPADPTGGNRYRNPA